MTGRAQWSFCWFVWSSYVENDGRPMVTLHFGGRVILLLVSRLVFCARAAWGGAEGSHPPQGIPIVAGHHFGHTTIRMHKAMSPPWKCEHGAGETWLLCVGNTHRCCWRRLTNVAMIFSIWLFSLVRTSLYVTWCVEKPAERIRARMHDAIWTPLRQSLWVSFNHMGEQHVWNLIGHAFGSAFTNCYTKCGHLFIWVQCWWVARDRGLWHSFSAWLLCAAIITISNGRTWV